MCMYVCAHAIAGKDACTSRCIGLYVYKITDNSIVSM